jgi:ferritin
MINKKINEAFNEQINEEIFSSYLYLSMATYFDNMGMTGFSHWFRLQAQEEMFHAMKFYHHIVERGGRVILKAIQEPEINWESTLNAFEAALKHEEHISACINDLMDLSMNEKDYASRSLLQWFVDEQVEEEASVTEIIDKLNLAGKQGHMVYMIDRELSARQSGVNPFDSTQQETE